MSCQQYNIHIDKQFITSKYYTFTTTPVYKLSTLKISGRLNLLQTLPHLQIKTISLLDMKLFRDNNNNKKPDNF